MASLNRYLGSFIAALLSSVSIVFFFMPIRNISSIMLLSIVLLLTLCYNQFFLSIRELNRLPKRKQFLLIAFTLVFSLLAVFSLKGEQQYLSDNSSFTIAYIYIGTYLTISCFVLWIILFLLRFEMRDMSSSMNKVSKWHILTYSLPSLMVWTLYLLAFFPGVMSRDSVDQWSQTHTGNFNNWHPVVHTLFIMFLRHIWDSPAIVGVTQIIIMSLIFGYCMFQFEKVGAKKSVLWIISLLFAISPVNGIYSITLWKDVFYSTFILLFSTVVLSLVVTNGDWLNCNRNMFIFLIASLGVVFFRHNGFPVFIAMAIVLLIVFRHRFKRFAFLSSLVVVIHYIVTGPIFDYLKVVPSDPNEALSIPTQQLANVIVNDGKITDEQAKYLNEILPLPLWKQYYRPYTTDNIKFSHEYNRKAIFPDHISTYLRTWMDICLQNPRLVTEAFIKQTSLVWQINPPTTNYHTLTYMTIIFHNPFGIKSRIIFDPLTIAVKKYLTISDTTLKPLIWRPATYTLLILLFTFVAFLRNDWKAWLVPLTVLLNTGTVLIALPAQDFRYLYSNSLVFFIAFLFAFISYKKKEMST